MLDPRNIEQIVKDAGQMCRLAIDHLHSLRYLYVRRSSRFQYFDGGANWRKRVTKFVSEHRQKFVLAPIGIFQLFFKLLAFGNVDDNIDGAERFSAGTGQQAGMSQYVAARPVRSLDNSLGDTDVLLFAQGQCHGATIKRKRMAVDREHPV